MSQGENDALIARFYDSFAALDGDAMQACYTAEASFADPVFTLHSRENVGGMWRMLCDTIRNKGRDAWMLAVSDIGSDAVSGRAHWEPVYRFSATGRLVHNIVDAQFTFKDGLIDTHRDRFEFWRWSRQALGPTGAMLGWSSALRNKVRAQAALNLATFLRARARDLD